MRRTEENTMADTDKIVEQLSGLTVLEIAGLVKQLEEKWGVSAAAPVAMAAAPAAGGGGAAAPAAEEKTTFEVILKEMGTQDRRDQGSAQRGAGPWPGGSESACRRRAKDDQGRRDQSRSR